MIRIAGINVPDNKRLEIALTAIYGIGKSLARNICKTCNLSYDDRLKNLTEEQINVVRNAVAEYEIEGDLRRAVSMNIKRLMELNTYRGWRHRKGLPVRGQRTCTNARTRKGKRKPIRK